MEGDHKSRIVTPSDLGKPVGFEKENYFIEFCYLYTNIICWFQSSVGQRPTSVRFEFVFSSLFFGCG